MELKTILGQYQEYIGKEVTISGWIRNHRKQKEFGFIDLHDGSCFKTIQCVYANELENFADIQTYRVGSTLEITGTLLESPAKGQTVELQATKVTLLGDCLENYPIQPKRHTREFLREQAYLRPRTNLFQAVFRVRSVISMSIHNYFQERNYVYVTTPLLTTADCEGSDQMFKVTTLNMHDIPKTEEGKCDFKEDLFRKETFITGTGQLHGEAFAMAFRNIYTFGPTFRTEKSNTKIHANEFWMIEPEIAFCDLEGLMDIEEEFLKYVIQYVIDKCPEEMAFFDSFVEKGLLAKLRNVLDSKFVRIDHKDCIDLLLNSGKEWEFTPDYEGDIAKEHEKFLTDHFGGPVFITNWPKDIKAWYMKLNEDGKTVAAVDLVVPAAGELMGGSQREEDYEKLMKRIEEMEVDKTPIEWYCNLRAYGTCVHAGFGMGLERLVMYLTGIDNIRDAIPFARTPGSCDY